MDKLRLFQLFELYYTDKATEAETSQLMQILKDLPNDEISSILQKTWDEQDESQRFSNTEMREKLLSKIHPDELTDSKIYPIARRSTRWMIRIAAAAVFVLMLSVTAYFLSKRDKLEISQAAVPAPATNKIVPGGNRAMLTLADGSQIVLDSIANGAISQQGKTQIIKLNDGKLAYNGVAGASEVLYNTVTTPKGGQYQIELSDGSKVWLNAASSLRFPTAFIGSGRTVELTGEGYFEVAHNLAMPFNVKIKGMEVEVLGTHFNINGYDDEPTTKTTLIEGRVKVTKNQRQVILHPGQQALLQPGQDDLQIAYDVDVDETMAWKNGRFLFNATDLESVMRQVARWYDVDLIYMEKIKGKISGNIKRTENILPLLRILEETGELKFKINGRKIIVTPK